MCLTVTFYFERPYVFSWVFLAKFLVVQPKIEMIFTDFSFDLKGYIFISNER